MNNNYEDRWSKFIELCGMTVTELAQFLDVTRSHIYDIRSGKANPTSKVLQRLGEIKTTNGKINLHWLLLGKGEMFLFEDPAKKLNTSLAFDLISREMEIWINQSKENTNQIAAYETQLEDMRTIIRALAEVFDHQNKELVEMRQFAGSQFIEMYEGPGADEIREAKRKALKKALEKL